ncbi:hypothetical protein PGTUg99_011422 [Puccinia graminis f. sp. tritici]|uniref:Uncharacterized protein n=1 Tax=Puccinia graminis f. sp. tritici TaxID=56615 RepID=A0A5B0S6I7_PUCGR|nr:hypothetical protein PGTUg99_011422 [Puccinia graminis f. sp. tritici]
MSARRCGNVARHCGSSSCDPQLVTSTQLAFCARPPSSNHSPLPSFEAVLHSIHQGKTNAESNLDKGHYLSSLAIIPCKSVLEIQRLWNRLIRINMSESNVSLSPRARKDEIAACPQSRLDKPPARLRCFVALQEGGRQRAGCSEKGTGMVTSESSAPAVASHKSEEVPAPWSEW